MGVAFSLMLSSGTIKFIPSSLSTGASSLPRLLITSLLFSDSKVGFTILVSFDVISEVSSLVLLTSEIKFSSGSICLVLASSLYNEDDYIRDYRAFLQYFK